MKHVNIQNLDRPAASPLIAGYCSSFMCRLRGLTFRSSLPAERGLLLVEAHDSRLDTAIHMLFVWMDLGVVWINNAGQVVDICLAKSWRPAYVPKQAARYVLEINPCRLAEFQVGDRLKFEEIWFD